MERHDVLHLLILSSTLVASASTVVVSEPLTTFLALLASSLFLAVLAIYLLSLLATTQQYDPTHPKVAVSTGDHHGPHPSSSLVWTTRLTGSVAAMLFFVMPYFDPGGPVTTGMARALGFAAACKTLDLAVIRAHNPPRRLNGQELISTTDKNRGEYIWLLLRECRYRSFDIAVIEKGRDGPTSPLWTFGPAIAIPLVAYLVPCAETRFLLGLLILQAALEGEQYLLHRSCQSQLLWQPFAAASASLFWRTHWQQDAASFLHSLAYRPAKDLVAPRLGIKAGRAVGVMAAFSLSGIWHAWAAAALSTTPWRTAIGMWSLFMIQAVLCLVESAIWKSRQGGIVQRILVWSVSIWSAGIWLRYAEKHTNVPWIQQKMSL